MGEDQSKEDDGVVSFSGNHILQGTMVYQHKEKRFNDPSWAFTTDGEYFLHFYPRNKTWTANKPEANSTIKSLETNTELENLLSYFSTRDINYSIDAFLKLWKKMPSK